MSLDLLIDTLVSDAQLAMGNGGAALHAQVGFARSAPGAPLVINAARWTPAEDAFLRDNLRVLGIDGCAAALGRSPEAVKIRFTRHKIAAAPSKTDGWLTANKAAGMLGIDAHKVSAWIECGILPGMIPAWTVRKIRLVSLLRLKMWLTRPESWVYVDVRKIQAPSLRRLVELAQARWGDEWWNTNQAAAYHGCGNDDIVRYIDAGKLPGVHALHMGGRDLGGWAYWFVRRSDAMRLRVFKGHRGVQYVDYWPARADAFICKARAEGKTVEELARMMKWPVKRVEYRARMLRKNEESE